jgi:hypothetical protein
LLESCSIERTKRSGPGGQHRNKVETAVVIIHNPSGVRAEASERRSQAANLAQAVFRLRVKLALSIRVACRPDLSALWGSRTTGGRMTISTEHDDFPAILAEALDALAARDWDTAAAAEFLKISASQLVKLLRHEGEALRQLNDQRTLQGKSRLK